MPDFLRRAIETQGVVDPDVVERQAAELLEATDDPEVVTPEQAALFNQPPPERHWQERGE